VTGVTWRELPADAPEPPPLSVVRDTEGDRWQRGADGRWRILRDDADKEVDGTGSDWSNVCNYVPLMLRLAEDPDIYAPWSPGGEPQIDQEVRTAYLAALDAQRRAFEAQAEAWPQMVEGWREMLTGQQAASSGRSDAEYYQAREDAERAEALSEQGGV
jgi:hypothetical protein